jgi:hypothetical protein
MSARASRLILAVGAIAVAALLAACGTSGATGSAGSSPSAAASVDAPSAAAPSESPHAASSAGPTLDLGSFDLPSGAKELEAILPNEMCGSTAIKFSMSGDQFADGADEEFISLLAALGKSPSDTSFAAAGSTDGDCGAGIFRINGVDTNQLQQTFLAASQDEGTTYSQSSIGGKNVFVLTMEGETDKQWVYFQGDAMLFVTADDEAQAATIIEDMP